MGTVYRAFQKALERDVALKVLDADEESEALERFRAEAIRVAQLKHPNILPVFDFGEQDGFTYIAMELADGGTLTGQIGQPMAPLRAIQILKPAAEALDYAHTRQIIHRDVKPANLLFDGNGRLFLSDFGLALILDSKSSTWGRMVGTPYYMAPEQFRDRAVPQSDIYSLAVTLFQMLTGRVPFDRENPLSVALAHLKDPVPSAREMNASVSEQIDRILRRGMAKNPEDRPARAIELLAAINEALKQGGAAPQPAARRPVPGAPARPGAAQPGRPAAAASQSGAIPTPAAQAQLGSPAPIPGPPIFESRPTLDWARANLILRDNKAGKIAITDGMIDITMSPPNHVQLMMLTVGVRDEVWAEVGFGVAPSSGIFDILWNEGTSPQSYCARVDTQQGRVAVGIAQAAAPGNERWLGARNVGLGPGTVHTLMLISAKGNHRAYLDKKLVVAVTDTSLSKGMVRLRVLPSPQNPTSNCLLRSLAVFRPGSGM
jgi:hypothetical protein